MLTDFTKEKFDKFIFQENQYMNLAANILKLT